MTETTTTHPPSIGWREWVKLPDLGIERIKAKVDTGARTSSLHAVDVKIVRRGQAEFVRFKVHQKQRNTTRTVETEAELVDRRYVRDSGGKQTLRPVVETTVEVLGARWPIELTLVARDEMGFRMLLGRQAIRRRFVVDPGRSYIGGRPRTARKSTAAKRRKKTAGHRQRRDGEVADAKRDEPT